MCGRSHTLYDAYAAIEALHAAGPPTWSLDLMSGYVGGLLEPLPGSGGVSGCPAMGVEPADAQVWKVAEGR